MNNNKIFKILSVLLTFSILAGCGTSDRARAKYEDVYENSDNDKNNEDENSDIGSIITTEGTEEPSQWFSTVITYENEVTSKETNVENETRVIDYGGIERFGEFSNGVAFIYTIDGRKILIDNKGQKIIEFNETWDNIDFLPEKVTNGSFVYADFRYSTKAGNKMYYLIDDEGNILRSTTNDGYTGFVSMEYYHHGSGLNAYKIDGYVIAYSTTKKYDGYEYKLGILDDEGNWIVPLSSDLNFFSLNNVDYSDLFNDNFETEFIYLGNNTFAFKSGNYYYCYNYLEDRYIATDLEGKPIGMNNNTIFFGDDRNSRDEFYSYNIVTGEIIKDTRNISDILPLGNALLIEEKNNNEYSYSLCDNGGETIFKFNDKFNSFKDNPHIYRDGYFIGFIKDNEYEDYLLCTDNTGKPIFEPIHINLGFAAFGDAGKLSFYNDIIYVACADGVHKYSLDGELIDIIQIAESDYRDWDYEAVYPEENLILIGRSEYAYIDLNGNILIK